MHGAVPPIRMAMASPTIWTLKPTALSPLTYTDEPYNGRPSWNDRARTRPHIGTFNKSLPNPVPARVRTFQSDRRSPQAQHNLLKTHNLPLHRDDPEEKTNFRLSTFNIKYSSIQGNFLMIFFDFKEKDFVSSRHPSNWVKHFPDAAALKAARFRRATWRTDAHRWKPPCLRKRSPPGESCPVLPGA